MQQHPAMVTRSSLCSHLHNVEHSLALLQVVLYPSHMMLCTACSHCTSLYDIIIRVYHSIKLLIFKKKVTYLALNFGVLGYSPRFRRISYLGMFSCWVMTDKERKQIVKHITEQKTTEMTDHFLLKLTNSSLH